MEIGLTVSEFHSRILHSAARIGEREIKKDIMNGAKKSALSSSILILEAISFIVVIFLVWIDEVIDIPHLFLGAEATPVNWRESTFETVAVCIVAAIVFYFTIKLFSKIKRMEKHLPICASCKRIRDANDDWHQLESFLKEKSVVEFTHTLCPDCRKKLYPHT
jgi:hypothetical protein